MSEATATETTEAPKPAKDSRFGWLMLGMCIDYFVFKPVRHTKPFWYIAFGFALGAAYTYGLDNIAAFVKGLVG